MNAAKREMRMEMLSAVKADWGCSTREAVEGVLIDFYEAAGFSADLVEKELAPMSEEELLNLFVSL